MFATIFSTLCARFSPIPIFLCGSADFQISGLAGFKTRLLSAGSLRSKLRRAADLEIGDPAGSETCATVRNRPAA
jgi:hypothetical protein